MYEFILPLRIYFCRISYKQIFTKARSFHCLQNRTCGIYLRLHSCIRIIPSPTQGIDPFEVYATRNNNFRPGIAGMKRARFDWNELLIIKISMLIFTDCSVS